MANREKEIRRFQRAADQRLTTADFLLENGFYLDAVYLAGYTVECSLKALILRWTPRREWEDMLERLVEAGAKGHRFEYLKGILKEQRENRETRDREVFKLLSENLRDVAAWSTDLRYQSGSIKPKEAQTFLAAAHLIRDWCARS